MSLYKRVVHRLLHTHCIAQQLSPEPVFEEKLEKNYFLFKLCVLLENTIFMYLDSF